MSAPFWKHPVDEPPPMGEKILLLTKGGIATIGHWGNDCSMWSPLPKRTREQKDRLDREAKLN